MKRLLICLLLVGVVGCGSEPAKEASSDGANGDSHEKVMGDYFDATDQMLGVMIQIHTVNDARHAKPRLEALKDELQDLARRARTLGRPDKATRDRLREEFIPRAKSISRTGRLMDKSDVGTNPQILAVLMDVFDDRSFLGPKLDWLD